jgi:hypothetical protein
VIVIDVGFAAEFAKTPPVQPANSYPASGTHDIGYSPAKTPVIGAPEELPLKLVLDPPVPLFAVTVYVGSAAKYAVAVLLSIIVMTVFASAVDPS